MVYVYEPDYGTIGDRLLEHNLSVQIYRALLEAEASEHGARMVAMDNATDNAEEMIQELTLQMNRLRQESITREILDVIGGVEAMR
jgi:F-type H+-transporting ATPase subunit gamma